MNRNVPTELPHGASHFEAEKLLLLSPEVDKIAHINYCDALKCGIDSKDVRNIALSGSYGTGKSSILKTFQEEMSDDYNFLKLSLATFQIQKKNDEVTAGNTNCTCPAFSINQNDSVAVSLEKSLLQQIFYQVENKDIPESRFKKIESFDRKKASRGIIRFFIIVFLATLFINISNLEQISKPFLSESAFLLFNLMIRTLLFFLIAYTSRPLIIELFAVLKKRKVASTSSKFIGVDFSNERDETGEFGSIFNRYLDEITYFFESTRKNIVIIEDIDRFEDSEIFEKLRELNMTLNSYFESVKDENKRMKIVFIYAVRDDVFEANSQIGIEDLGTEQNLSDLVHGGSLDYKLRAKFFDLIIPVVPIINTSNSAEKLAGFMEESGYEEVSDNLLYDIAMLYIHDMRVLKNIVNEYGIYRTNFGISYSTEVNGSANMKNKMHVNPEKLFAMIVYKNLYPGDFAKIQEGKSALDGIFSADELERFNLEVSKDIVLREQQAKGRYNELLNQRISEKLMEYAKRIGLRKGDRNYHVYLNGRQYHYENWIKPEMAGILRGLHINHQISSKVLDNIGEPRITVGKLINFDGDLLEELREVEQKVDNSRQARQLLNLKKEKVSLGLMSVQEIYSKYLNVISIPKVPGVLKYFISNGYIDEDYKSHITYFYPGRLLHEDIEFYKNVKEGGQKNLSPKLTLFGLKKLEERIRLISDYNSNAVLNYDFVKFLYKENVENKNEKLKRIHGLLNSGSDFEKRFISGLLARITFDKLICNKFSHYTEERYNRELEEGDVSKSMTVYLKDFLEGISIEADCVDSWVIETLEDDLFIYRPQHFKAWLLTEINLFGMPSQGLIDKLNGYSELLNIINREVNSAIFLQCSNSVASIFASSENKVRYAYLDRLVRTLSVEDLLEKKDEFFLSTVFKEVSLQAFINFVSLSITDGTSDFFLENLANVMKATDVKISNISIGVDVKVLSYGENYNVDCVVDWIIKNELCELNNSTLNFFMEFIDVKIQEPKYANILGMNEKIKSWVNNNIEYFVENIYLMLDDKDEDEEAIISLIRNKDLSSEAKNKICEEFNFSIEDITRVSGYGVLSTLIKFEKFSCTWNNIAEYYRSFTGISNELIMYLNNPNNYRLLSKITKEVTWNSDIVNFDEEELTIEKFSSNLISAILSSKEVVTDVVAHLLCGMEKFNFEHYEKLSVDKVELLASGGFIQMSCDNLRKINDNFNRVVVPFIESDFNSFSELTETIELSNLSFVKLANSRLTIDQKELIFEKVGFEPRSVEAVEESSFFVNESLGLNFLKDIVLSNNIAVDKRVSLISSQIKYLEINEVRSLLKIVGGYYGLLSEVGKKPKIPNDIVNYVLVEELKKSNMIASWSEGEELIKVNLKRK